MFKNKIALVGLLSFATIGVNQRLHATWNMTQEQQILATNIALGALTGTLTQRCNWQGWTPIQAIFLGASLNEEYFKEGNTVLHVLVIALSHLITKKLIPTQ